jgi:hypothetical protein
MQYDVIWILEGINCDVQGSFRHPSTGLFYSKQIPICFNDAIGYLYSSSNVRA